MEHTETAEWLKRAGVLKASVMDKFELMSEAQRSVAPNPGDWSAAGVVEHLVLVEENLVGLWRQRLVEMPSAKVGLKAALLSAFVTFGFSKTNMRVPTFSELEPQQVLSLEELRARWESARQRLVSSLPDDPRGAWILHPLFGPLSSEQMGKLLASHIEHHLRHWPSPKA